MLMLYYQTRFSNETIKRKFNNKKEVNKFLKSIKNDLDLWGLISLEGLEE